MTDASNLTIGILVILLLLTLIIEEARIMQIKSALTIKNSKKLPYDSLYALLILYGRVNSKLILRARDYDRAIQTYCNSLKLRSLDTPGLLLSHDDFIRHAVKTGLFIRDWSEIPISALNLRVIMQDKELIERELSKFNKPPWSPTLSKENSKKSDEQN